MKNVRKILMNISILFLLISECQPRPTSNDNLQKCLDDLNTHAKYFGRPRYGRSIPTHDFDSGPNNKEEEIKKYLDAIQVPSLEEQKVFPIFLSDCSLDETQRRWQRQVDTLRLMRRFLDIIQG